MTAAVHFEAVANSDGRVASAWEAWVSTRALSPFALPAFFDVWRRAFASQRRAFVVVGSRGGEPVFVLPMWTPVDDPRRWSSLGTFRADYTEAALVTEDAAIGTDFWRWLERRAPCDVAKIGRVPKNSILGWTAPALAEDRTERAFRASAALVMSGRLRSYSTTIAHEHPYADRALIKELGDRIRGQEVRRKINLLARQGGDVTYRVVRDPAELTDLLPHFFRTHVENFAGTGRQSQFVRSEERAFYEALVVHPGMRGVVCMDVVSLAERPVAMHLGFEMAGVIYYYKPTFELALARTSPGRTLMANLFARAKASGARQVDLLKGEESYKGDWSTMTRATVTTTLRTHDPLAVVRSVTRRLGGSR